MKNFDSFQSLRFGFVSDYNPNKHLARILFPDLDNLISAWLPVIVHNSRLNHDEFHLDVNEHVAVLLLGNGTEQGLVLGAVYDDDNRPSTGNQNIRCVTFQDGTAISYDRDTHNLTADVKGDITLKASGKIIIEAAGNITVKGSRIDLN